MNGQTSSPPVAPNIEVPLVVDVDGTLVSTDLLQEAMLQFIARQPLQAFRILIWMIAGKSRLKTQLADRVTPGIETVPLRTEVVALIRVAQAEGRLVYLASGSDRRYVEELARRIGGIAGVFGTDENTNLSGDIKASRLVATFGMKRYDYIGNAPVDFAVWSAARKALVVAGSGRFTARIHRVFPNAEIVAEPRAATRDYIAALRPHQWAKNVLLFLPMIAGHRFNLDTVAATLLAFFCFCLAASSAYVINDLVDLPSDRANARKSRRPFAAGKIPIAHGLGLAVLLMLSAFALSLLLPWRFSGILATYVSCTVAYSLLLKRKVLVDVIMLGGLYTLRVFGGLAATNSNQSQWLLMFSLFLFLSLAVVKRCSELVANRAAGKVHSAGRGYRVEDLNVLLPLGAAAGYGAVFVVTLYLSSPEVIALYAHPHRLWLICPLLLYWISRVLVFANRGDVHDDPVIFALRDRVSWITGFCVASIVAVSI
jgi:4-hydroxybenzoate polyprenyltransferase